MKKQKTIKQIILYLKQIWFYINIFGIFICFLYFGLIWHNIDLFVNFEVVTNDLNIMQNENGLNLTSIRDLRDDTGFGIVNMADAYIYSSKLLILILFISVFFALNLGAYFEKYLKIK